MALSRFHSFKPKTELPPLSMEENGRGRVTPAGESLPPYKLHSYWLREIQRLGEEVFDKAGSYRKIKQFAGEHKEHAQMLLAHLKPLEKEYPVFVAELEEQIRITVLHELAHYFGFEEDRISELGYE